MKKRITLIVFALIAICTLDAKAQETSSWTTGVDLYSSYVWRGTKFGSGPALQPTVKYTKGGFSIGAWGNYCFSTEEAKEADLFASYAIGLGENSSLTISATDYYFPDAEYFDGDSHFFEPMISLGLGKLSLSAAYMKGSDDSDIEDTYLEAGFNAGTVILFAGAGDGQYTEDGDFEFCNVGIKTSRTIKISDSFSIPVNGSIILNPSTEQFNIVVGISL